MLRLHLVLPFFFALSSAYSLSGTPCDRRTVLQRAVAAASVVPLAAVSNPAPSAAAGNAPPPSASDLLQRLRRVPCFAIVDKDGAPYMIVDKKTRGATGYFFLTFNGAQTVLSDAKKAAEGGGYSNVWEAASITSVPLDVALRLSLRKMERSGQNDVKVESIVDIIPGMDETEDSLKIDPSGKFNEQGRVPLFYVEEGLEVPSDNGVGGNMLPVYFNRKDLESDWNAVYAGKDTPLPRVKVIDLLDLFQATLRGSNEKNVVFSPSPEALKAAAEIQSKKITPAYKNDKMVMVGGKS